MEDRTRGATTQVLTTIENLLASPLSVRVVMAVVGRIIIYLLSRPGRRWLMQGGGSRQSD